jgi:hypothetical protein
LCQKQEVIKDLMSKDKFDLGQGNDFESDA